jgi:cytoskeletal protein RodZ
MASAAWIRPAVILGILVIVAFVVWQFVAGRSAQETAQQAAGQAQQAAQQATGAAQQAAGAAQEAASSAVAMVGGVDLGKEITGHLTKLGSVFGGITNTDTARSAVPSLQDISGSVDKLKGLSAQLPASGRSALAALVAKSLPPLRSALDKANAIPGVGDVIRPVADPLMASLGELAKAPA